MLVAEMQNLTLGLPRDLLKRVKRVAVDRGSSVSALVAEALTRVAADHRRYSFARRQSLAALRSAGSLGTKGQRIWTRDELHER